MNKFGKWTGIALIGASVLAFDGVALSVGVGAAREFLASPEAHAVEVASRIVGRALLHQAVGGALRIADNLRVVGLRGAPDALADAALALEPKPGFDMNFVCCDRTTEAAIREAQQRVRQMHCELRAQQRQFEIQARMEAVRARIEARSAQRVIDREQLRQRIQQQIQEQRELLERMRAPKQTI